jgi:hypothetical protein
MELEKQKKIEQKINILRALIETNLGVDVKEDRSRKRHVVDARLIYANILRQEGLGCTQIARSLRKDHATILHYFRVFNTYIGTDLILKDTYQKITDIFEEEVNSNPLVDENDLKKELYVLRSKIKSLTSANRILNSKLRQKKRTEERLQDIFSLIEERTKEGSENEILNKLTRFYNGVYDY